MSGICPSRLEIWSKQHDEKYRIIIEICRDRRQKGRFETNPTTAADARCCCVQASIVDAGASPGAAATGTQAAAQTASGGAKSAADPECAPSITHLEESSFENLQHNFIFLDRPCSRVMYNNYLPYFPCQFRGLCIRQTLRAAHSDSRKPAFSIEVCSVMTSSCCLPFQLLQLLSRCWIRKARVNQNSLCSAALFGISS